MSDGRRVCLALVVFALPFAAASISAPTVICVGLGFAGFVVSRRARRSPARPVRDLRDSREARR
jgi:hypothetical protein